MARPKRCGVYLIVNTATDDFYIGSSVDLQRRRVSHWSELNRGVHKSPWMQHAWRVYGAAAFVWREIIHAAPDEVRDIEQAMLDAHARSRSCYNASASATYPDIPRERREIGHAKMRGQRRSDETRARIAAAKRGTTLPADVRAKISATLTGRVGHNPPPHVVDAFRRRMTGRAVSAETRQRLSDAHRGQSPNDEQRAKLSAALTAAYADGRRTASRAPLSDARKQAIRDGMRRRQERLDAERATAAAA